MRPRDNQQKMITNTSLELHHKTKGLSFILESVTIPSSKSNLSFQVQNSNMSCSSHIEPVISTDLAILASIETDVLQSSALNSIIFRNWADTKTQSSFFLGALKDMFDGDFHFLKAVNTINGEIQGYIVSLPLSGKSRVLTSHYNLR